MALDYPEEHRREALGITAGVVLLLFAMLSPATLPWYYAWGMALLEATAWTARRMSIAIFVSVFLVVAAFPSGEVALYAWGYLLLMLACAAVAARWPAGVIPPTSGRARAGAGAIMRG